MTGSDDPRPLDVLIVEDEPAHVELLRSLLGRHPGHDVRCLTARSLAQARERLAAGGVDLVLLDLNLPDSTGLDTLRALDPMAPDTPPVVVVTGQGGRDDVPEAIRMGAQDFLIKGVFKGHRLSNAVTASLERHALARSLRESENNYRTLFDSIQDAVLVADTGRRIVDCNKAFTGMFGYGRDEVVGRETSFIYEDEDEFRRCGEAIRRRVDDPGDASFELIRFRRKTGEVFSGEVSIFSVRDAGGRVRSILGSIRDVTEREAAEAALRESERRLRYVTETMDDVFWMSSPGIGENYYISPAYERIWGRSLESLMADPTSFMDAVHPDDADRVRAEVEEHRRGEWDLEYRIVRPDGDVRWIQDRGYPVFDAQGRLSLMVGSARDVTEHRRVEQALMELARYPEANPNPVLKAGVDGILEYANPAADVLREHLAGPDGRLLPPLSDVAARALEHNRVETSDLEIGGRWFAMSCAPLEAGGGVNVYGLDIAERKRAEQALGESEARYKGLFSSIRDAILVADTDRRIIDCNQAFCDLFGYSLDDIRGLPTSSVYESDEEFQRMGVMLKDKQEEGYELGEFLFLVHYRKQSGEVFPGETNVFYLRDASGDVRGFIGLVRDITDRRREEERLKRRVELESLLSEVAMRLLGTEPGGLDDVVSDITERVCLFSGVDRCYFMTVGGPRETCCVSSESYREGMAPLDAHQSGLTVARHSWWFSQLKAGAIIHLNDVELLPDEADEEKRNFRRRGVRSVLAVPMNTDGRLEGYLGLENHRERHSWTGEDIIMLETFAGIIVNAIERARAVAGLDWNLKVKAALAMLYKPIISPFATIDTISEAILMRAKELTDSPAGYVASVDEHTGDMRVHTQGDMMHGGRCRIAGEQRKFLFKPDGKGRYPGLWGYSLNTGEPLVLNVLQGHPASMGLPEGHVSLERLCSIPVFLGEDAVGQITLGNKPSPYLAEDVEAVRQMGEYYALALERLRARERLDEAESRFLNVVETMYDGMAMMDETATVSYANQRMADMLGLGLRDIFGHRIQEFMDPDSAERMQRAMGESERLESESLDLTWLGRHGGIRTVVSRTPIIDDRGRYRGAFCIVHDISERLRLERQLLQAQKLESIGQLAAGVAHEINTPAQYVGNNIRFLQRSLAELLQGQREMEAMLKAAAAGGRCPDLGKRIDAFHLSHDFKFIMEELPEAVAESIEGIDRISEIVRSVKQFAHPGDQEKALSDINEAVGNTVLVSTNEWKYAAELDTDLAEDLPPVPCVSSEIKQVVLNLIINAAHAIEDKLGQKPSTKGRITVRTRLADDHVLISVSDTGTGIPDAMRARVFDPFFTTKAVGRGTGQGLSIAHTIISEKHGGSIDFETEEGIGSTFTVRLPLALLEERE